MTLARIESMPSVGETLRSSSMLTGVCSGFSRTLARPRASCSAKTAGNDGVAPVDGVTNGRSRLNDTVEDNREAVALELLRDVAELLARPRCRTSAARSSPRSRSTRAELATRSPPRSAFFFTRIRSSSGGSSRQSHASCRSRSGTPAESPPCRHRSRADGRRYPDKRGETRASRPATIARALPGFSPYSRPGI